jgi:hypothetical protein
MTKESVLTYVLLRLRACYVLGLFELSSAISMLLVLLRIDLHLMPLARGVLGLLIEESIELSML